MFDGSYLVLVFYYYLSFLLFIINTHTFIMHDNF